LIIFSDPKIVDLIWKEREMKPMTEKFLFYLGYVVTILAVLGATFFIWSLGVYTMLKILLLLPLIYISVLLTLSLEDGFKKSRWS